MLAPLVLSIVPALLLCATPQQFSGTWQSETNGRMELILDNSGESIHVTEMHDGKVHADYTCQADGKDCEIKEGGHKAKVSLWVNGPYLVELRKRGDSVVKRRFLLKDDNKTLQVEVMPISPPGKTETAAYSRAR